MGKTWKSNGTEDTFIDKLILKGKVNKFTKPQYLKENFPKIFDGFSEQVIRNHLNVLKRNHGLYLEDEIEDGYPDDKENVENGGDSKNVENGGDAKTVDTTHSGNFVHKNYPAICEIYKDPDNQCEKVAMVVSMPAGVDNVLLHLAEDGLSVKITYEWSSTMYDMNDLYKKLSRTERLPMQHPRVLCVKNALEKFRDRIDTAPMGEITLKFPIKVQTLTDSWSQSGVGRDDGTQILIGDFTGHQKIYNTKLSDSVVKFD